MKSHAIKKSSFTLPPSEVSRVNRLKKRLRLKSNTAVVRRALSDLEARVDRNLLREQFQQASLIVRESHLKEMAELDHLAGEGL